MGLTSWPGKNFRKLDTEIAKNYLNPEELNILNRIVSMYLDFAELQALNRKPMYMADWVAKLDHFLQMTERDILSHAGTISHETTLDKARTEYAKYQKSQVDVPSPVEQHFLEAVKEVQQIDSKKK